MSQTSNTAIAVGRVKKQDRRLLAEFRLWDVVKGQQVLGQQYVVGSERHAARSACHSGGNLQAIDR
jgi:hypothetical protein